MTKEAKKRIVVWLLVTELFGIGAMAVVSRAASDARSAEQHAQMLLNSLVKLDFLVNDAQLLSASYRLSTLVTLKEGCIKTGQGLEFEVSCPWWQATPDLWPDENPAQWGRIKQLGQAVATTLTDPDKLKQLTPEQAAALKRQFDALKSELDNVRSKQYEIWLSNNAKDVHLGLAAAILQMVVVPVLYTFLAVLIVNVLKDDGLARPRSEGFQQPTEE